MPADVQQIADDLASELNKSVVIVTPTIQVLASSRHFGDEDNVRVHGILQRQASSAAVEHILNQGVLDWYEPGYLPYNADIAMKQRLCVPIRWHGTLLAFLMLLVADNDALPASAVAAAELAANHAASSIFRQSQHNERRREYLESLLDKLTSQNPKDTEEAARTLAAEENLHGDEDVAVLVVDLAHPGVRSNLIEASLRTAIESASLSTGGATVLYSVRSTHADVVLAGPRLPEQAAQAFADIVRKTLGDDLSHDLRPWTGIASSEAGIYGVREAQMQAAGASKAARILDRPNQTASFDELGAYALLVNLAPEMLDRLVHPGVSELIRTASDSTELIKTAEVFLDHGPTAVTDRLHVHRATVYYRLKKITELTGLDMNDGADRFTLHLSIAAARLARIV